MGVHKLIGASLDIKPTTIYQAIKTIRAELNLPQYNDPTVHESADSNTDQHQGEETPASSTDQQKSEQQLVSDTTENVSTEPALQENKQDSAEAKSEI